MTKHINLKTFCKQYETKLLKWANTDKIYKGIMIQKNDD